MAHNGIPSRPGSATSPFGVSRREAHDASAFYARFPAPQLQTGKQHIGHARPIPDSFVCADARRMQQLADNEVALVVTSPPYFAGKQYELELGQDGVPSSYAQYLQMLTDVFAECKRVLEPGGRAVINVANLGRRPYRSLSSDVMRIMQDQLGMLPVGEIIWRKGAGANGSCAWGSFVQPVAPVLRDTTERLLVFCKGQFKRYLSPQERQEAQLPYQASVHADEFMASTLDVWELAPESATRVGHPAPFPVSLPARCIELYTWANDLVLDPFMGSGSTLVAAAQLGRRYIGYDTDPAYVQLARQRVAQEGAPTGEQPVLTSINRLAEQILHQAGFVRIAPHHKVVGTPCSVSFGATDQRGRQWFFELAGDLSRSGTPNQDRGWEIVGKAHAITKASKGPLVVLTARPLKRPGQAWRVAASAGPRIIRDVICMLDEQDLQRLAEHAAMQLPQLLPGFWDRAHFSR